MRHMREANSGGSEGLLSGAWELRNIPKGIYSHRPFDSIGAKHGGNALSNAEDIDAIGNRAVLKIPPDRNPNAPALLLMLSSHWRRMVALGATAMGGIIGWGGVEEEKLGSEWMETSERSSES